MNAKEKAYVSRLLRWHKTNAADFPWRNTKDPYRILMSEILLRKTTRKQVNEIFGDFLSNFPSWDDLAGASVDKIRKVITPLGIAHGRARTLKKLAKAIMHHYYGKVPEDRRQLLNLPGLGPYSANAVLCFAFGKDQALVDTNVVRILGRIFSISSSKRRPHTDRKLWQIASDLLPTGKAREFNLAMLDFAASVCLPRKPRCSACPMLSICDYGSASFRISESGPSQPTVPSGFSQKTPGLRVEKR